jgi:hypothetical protein
MLAELGLSRDTGCWLLYAVDDQRPLFIASLSAVTTSPEPDRKVSTLQFHAAVERPQSQGARTKFTYDCNRS